MIRFACPSCNSVFTVADEKAGKSGKCPKCQSQFMIPDADPPATPPALESDDVEIKPCPGCQSKLVVGKDDLGLEVECPNCKTVYKAEAPGGTKSTSSLSKRSAAVADDDDDQPRRKTDRFGEERDDEDDDDDERPRRRKKRRRRSNSSGSVTTVAILNFVLGGLGLLCSCGLFGFGAAIQNILKDEAVRGRQAPLEPETMVMLFMVLGACYLVMALLMIVGGIGLQQRKVYGRYITFATSTIAILFGLVSCLSLIGNVIAAKGAGICGGLIGIFIWGGYGVFALIVMINSGREFD
jgi:DNA-directed RNA polymerase subunit M/transcription elongation factor TFIIS